MESNFIKDLNNIQDIGIDITSINRFVDFKPNYIDRILTIEEKQIFNSLSNEKKATFLATRWAAKEAIFKATQDNKYLSYSILNDENGKPYILNHQELKISISHEDNLVIAIVIKTN